MSIETLEIIEEKRDYRVKKLFSLGLEFDGKNLYYEDINFHWTDIITMSDEDFEKAFDKASERMDTLRKEGVVFTKAEPEKQTNSLVKANEEINQGLAAFENKKAELTTLAEASKIKITGIDDKENIKKADAARKALKAERVQITKDGKAMRDQLTVVSRKISEKEKELIGIISPVEDDLQKKLDEIEAEKERIRQEEIAKEEARIQKRIDALAEYGFMINYTDVKLMTDENFDNYLEAAKVQFEKEQAEKAEAERIEKERQEAERIAKEAEEKRLEAERKELEELRAKQAEAQRIIDEQNAKIEAERKKVEEEKAALEAARQKAIDDAKREAELKKAREEAAEAARLKAIEDAKEVERLKKEAEEKARIAEERKAARQPDKVKIQAYIAAIKAVPVPELKTEDAKHVMSSIQELISRFDSYATEKASAL